MVQCATLDLKEAEFGWQSELVTTKKCEFSCGKTNDSIVLHDMGNETDVCAIIDLIRSGFGHRMPTTDGKRSQA